MLRRLEEEYDNHNHRWLSKSWDGGAYADLPDAEVDYLGQPPLRTWNLTSNSTRYDRIVAAPSDETLVLMWSMWTVLFALIASFIWIVVLGILCARKKVRSQAFNL